SPRALRVGSRTGVVLPAHATSVGKAVLAELPRERLHELYPAERLPGMTPNTTTSRRKLEAELALVREQGYATNVGESEPDVSAVGVAIRNGRGSPRMGISVAVPLSR